MKKVLFTLYVSMACFFFQTSNAQNTILNIEETTQLTVKEIFDLIQNKTNYQFVYRYDLIKNSPKIQLDKGQIKVKDLLTKGLNKISCTYEFDNDHTIIVKNKASTNNKMSSINTVSTSKTIEATLLDKQTNLPIIYANIGFVSKGIGTISNENGYFKLSYNSETIGQDEVLQISTLGYKTLKINSAELSNITSKGTKLHLDPEPLELDEILLSSIKRKKITLGHTRANPETMGYWSDKEGLGGEIATKIDVRRENTKLLNLKFNVVENESDSLKIRVKVYDYAKRRPTKELLSENIFYTIKKKKGLVTIDLEPYNITVDNDFVISIELIKVYGKTIYFSVSGEPHGGVAFKRYVSQDKWERFNNIGMSFSVLASVPERNSKGKPYVDEPEASSRITSITNSEDRTNEQKIIKGKITLLNRPLPNVNISIKGTSRGTKTDANGFYQLNADVSDMLQYSHVGLKTVYIVVEDITSTLNIDMVENINKLDESVVSVRKKVDPVEKLVETRDVTLQLPNGTINPHKSGFDIKHIEGKKLNLASPDLASALDGKYAGVKATGTYPSQKLTIRGVAATYVLNGIEYDEPPIPLTFIKDVFILKTRAMVILVPDDHLESQKIEREKIAEKHRNQNYYKDDARVANSDVVWSSSNNKTTRSTDTIEKTIRGTITAIHGPLQNVNIKIKGHVRGTKTDAKGQYSIHANIGDILEFSHVGYHTISIIIEDVTDVLDIEMFAKTNELDEVVVEAKKKKSLNLERIEKAEKPVVTSRGTLDPKRATYPISFIDGEEIKPIYQTLTQALVGKRAGISIGRDKETGEERIMVKPVASINTPIFAIWDVDGQIFEVEPPMDLNNVQSVHILKTLSATNKYGSVGAGGVVVVRTKNGTFNATEAQRKKVAQQFQNKNYYANDATLVDNKMLLSNSYTETIESLNNVQSAYTYYNDKLKDKILSYNIHISIAHSFLSYYNNYTIGSEILNNLAQKHQNHPEILKAIAYQFEAIGAKRYAENIYESIYRLRPKYAQSYRDLANAYVENDQFNKAWKLYKSYLLQGNNGIDEGIGQTVYNEMEFLYFNRNRQTQIKDIFKPKSEDLFDFRNDIRIVFEWNTSEAEFDLEFVAPDKRAYVFEHSIAANQDLITDEKRKGYSSKDFFIDNLDSGEWLVNLTYYGNKKPQPTYFKMTIFYNWGKAAQKKEVLVYNLTSKSDKIQLKKMTKDLLIVSN